MRPSSREPLPPALQQPLHALFEQRARAAADDIAAVYEGQRVTYAQLNERANQLARVLRARGLQPGDYLPVIMSRSLQLLIAQLATLKAGAVYVPLDPSLPEQRRAFIVQDCAARLILTEDATATNLPASVAQVSWAAAAAAAAATSITNLDLPVHPNAPAYVMYTSGSTGTPKGVVVPHRGVVRLAIDNGYADIDASDCIAHHSNPAFDASTFEIWAALLNGARIAIVPQSIVLDAPGFARFLSEHGVTVMYMSVGLFNQYTQALACVFPRLRHLLVGGEALEALIVRRVLSENPPRRFLNAYGPTECTTFASTHLVRGAQECAVKIPIGSAIAQTQFFITDSNLVPVAVGVTGDIYIGGAGLAHGYLNRAGLTAERFVVNPFSSEPGARMYRTGDLGCWRQDGTIEYLGRSDQQVKIRGFRIEPAEIEAQLLQDARISNAVVIAREDPPAPKRLVAYVTIVDGHAVPSSKELRSALAPRLPEYMLPSAYVVLERLPINVNGKVDRHALPAPQLDAYASGEYQPLIGDAEETLGRIWQSLLRIERVGRMDNFFELGGHSLLIVQMLDQLRRAGLSVAVDRVFQARTLAELAQALTPAVADPAQVPRNLIAPDCELITPHMLPLVMLEAQQIARIADAIPGGTRNIEDIYPLTALQEGILFHHLLSPPGEDAYVVSTLIELRSRQHLDQLVAALATLIRRHEVLRTAIFWEGLPQPVQVVQRCASLPLEELSADARSDSLEQLEGWIDGEAPLDLRHAPLLRVRVARDLASERWYALIQLHHIIADNRSQAMFTSELAAHMKTHGQALPPPMPYRNHVAHLLGSVDARADETFFRAKLASVRETTAPFGITDTRGRARGMRESHRSLEATLAANVRALGKRLGVSAATIFHAAWSLVVAHTSARDDVVFGTVLLGRLHSSAGAERVLGMFINTLPLRLALGGLSIAALIERTRCELVELFGHEQAALALAQRCSDIEGSAPLFSALLNYRHRAFDSEIGWADVPGVRVLAEHAVTHYPITFSVDDQGEGFELVAQTDQRIDPSRLIDYMQGALRAMVQALAEAPQTPALMLSILPDEERDLLLHGFNATRAPRLCSPLIHRLFEEQCDRTPHAIAVEHEGRSISYTELHQRAQALARQLRDVGVGPDEVVGICAHRSIEMIVGILAILKAGGAYLPLDPHYPAERLQYMLGDAAPRAVLIERSLLAALPLVQSHVVVLDHPLPPAQSDEDGSASLPSAPQNLLYVIYTSGSTGQPKGTAMSHGAMANLIEWHQRQFSAGARVLQFAALSFDVAFQEIFSTLCTGGSLVLLDEGVRKDPRALLQLLAAQRIERLFLPPMMLQALAESFSHAPVRLERLRDVIVAGEQLRVSAEMVALFAQLGGARLHNHYGPTETHVVTALTLSDQPQRWPALPTIGRPIANTHIYILDARRQLCPVGVPGEIYIGGANIARGYLHRAEMTVARFISDPFAADPSARLYKTGDLGRWNRDGTIEYLGRNDDQVKIRGFRIELGEIEAQLKRHERVKEVAVTVREEVAGQKRLVAYLSCRGPTLQIEDLRSYAQSVLPEHMVPSAFVTLEDFPLTPSGKLNRRALPAPGAGAYSHREYEPPQGAIEESLAEIWKSLLNVEQVSRHDNFFELGGNSLTAMKLAVRIAQRLELNIGIDLLMGQPVVAQLAQSIETLRLRKLAQEDPLDSEEIAI